MPSVLIVDDDADLSAIVARYLESEGFAVVRAASAEEAYDVLGARPFDLVLLDINLPGDDGFAACEALRRASDVPIVFASARTSETDRIVGLDTGGDDYLPKPFEPDELICRVRAMLRRGGSYHPAVLSYGGVSLDTGTGMLSCGERSVRLSGREFQVMELFPRSPKIVLSAERIMERVWGWDSDVGINVVWVHISNLRKRLKAIGMTIQANHGLGYILEAER